MIRRWGSEKHYKKIKREAHFLCHTHILRLVSLSLLKKKEFEIIFTNTAGVRGMKCGAKARLDPLWDLDKFINTAGVTSMICGVEIVTPAAGLRQIPRSIL